MSRHAFIVNLVASGGDGLKGWEKFCSLWPEKIDKKDIYFTESPGHISEIAVSCSACDVIVAVGGDGTASDVLSGIMQRTEPHPKFAVIPTGTGNDIANTAGIYTIEDGVKALRQGSTQRFDLIKIICQRGDDQVQRYGFLYCDIGFSTACHRMLKPWMKRIFGAKGAYFLIAFLGVFVYKPAVMKLRFQDHERNGRMWMVFIGNAEWSAGGNMRLAPGALPNDGELNVAIIPIRSKLEILFKLSRIAKGEHINDPGVEYFPVQNIEIESETFAGVEIDGDIFGNTPAKVSICPAAIKLIALNK